MTEFFIKPNWPAPTSIHAFSTLRASEICHFENTQGERINRERLKNLLPLPSEPIWLNQVHSGKSIPAITENIHQKADATFTNEHNKVCIVQTADCLPILICHQSGSHVAAIHAGWKGLALGIIEDTLTNLHLPHHELFVWLGPCIAPQNYEVRKDVFDVFMQQDTQLESAFEAFADNHWYLDLKAIAHFKLQQKGIKHIYGTDYCTYRDEDRFFSYRRDGKKTGRILSLIWTTESTYSNINDHLS